MAEIQKNKNIYNKNYIWFKINIYFNRINFINNFNKLIFN